MKKYEYNPGTFIGKGGVEIFFQGWTKKKPAGIILIIHGLGEHSGRYGNIIDELKNRNLSILSFDQRGHGNSEGKRGHINSFMDYIEDINIFIKMLRVEHEKLPIILMGHSMGGLIALKYTLTHPGDIKGLILSSPYLKLAVGVPWWKTSLGNLLSGLLPALSMPTGLDPEEISTDKETVEAYRNDPLIHSLVSTRWYTETTAAREECIKRGDELKMPVLLFHGKEDGLVDYRGTEEFHKTIKGKKSQLHLFDGLRHETMNEVGPERKKVLKIVSAWIGKRILKRK